MSDYITYALDTSKGFDVFGDSTLRFHSLWGGNNQKFSMHPDGTIKVEGKCVNVPSTSDGTNLNIKDCLINSSEQKFEYDTKSKRIIHAESKKCLDLPGGQTHDGANITLYPCHDGNNQKWNLNHIVSPYITYAADPSKGLDKYGDSTLNLDPIWGGENQKFTMHADGTIKVQGQCVNLPSISNGTSLNIKDCVKDLSEQKFEYDKNSKRIIHSSSRKCLDLPGGQTGNGTDITIWDCHDGVNQKWNINYIAPAQTSTSTSTLPASTSTSTPVQTSNPASTLTPVPTSTPASTLTSTPSSTPASTSTSTPSSTPTSSPVTNTTTKTPDTEKIEEVKEPFLPLWAIFLIIIGILMVFSSSSLFAFLMMRKKTR